MRYETTIGKDRGIRTGMKDKAGAPAVFSEQFGSRGEFGSKPALF